MRILIVGSDSNAYSLAKYFRKNEHIDVVFVAPGNAEISKIAEVVDISESEKEELLDFAIANEISLTVVTSLPAIYDDIAGLFNEAKCPVFAPSAESSFPMLYKSASKKMMYRLGIPTMKFGIFERENQAIEYISNARRALVIKNDVHIPGEKPVFAASFSKAKNAVEKSIISPENKIIIEDYIDAKEVSMYFLTDGYSVLPIGTCMSDEDFAYPLSVFSPDNIISHELEDKILKEVIYPVIDDISERFTPYCGIFGIDIFVNNDDYNIIEFNPFFKQMHLQAILPTIKSNLYNLFLSCIYGSLADEYSHVNFCDNCTFSQIVENIDKCAVEFLDDEALELTYTGHSHSILTRRANTLQRAKSMLMEDIEFLKKYEAEDV